MPTCLLLGVSKRKVLVPQAASRAINGSRFQAPGQSIETVGPVWATSHREVPTANFTAANKWATIIRLAMGRRTKG